VSNYELNDLGDGRFELSGEMSFKTANSILKSSSKNFGQYESLELDMSKVGKADSAGLALMVEWQAQTRRRAAKIRFVAVPESLRAIAVTCDVADLI
jgi:phospholipid transport system transporter-binding protein